MKGEKGGMGSVAEGSELDDEGRNITHYNSGELVCPCETDNPSSLDLIFTVCSVSSKLSQVLRVSYCGPILLRRTLVKLLI